MICIIRIVPSWPIFHRINKNSFLCTLKKQPTWLELIKKIADMFANESATLKDLRLATMSVMSFAGLFRSKKLLNIWVCNVSLKGDRVKIQVPSSKTDVYRKDLDVFISRSNTNACPALLLDKYLQKANVTLNDSSDYLFRNLIYLKKTKQYILGKKGVSCTRFRELFKKCLGQLGYDCSVYSLHSFRAD